MGIYGPGAYVPENWAEAEEAFWRAVSLIPESMKGIYDTTSSITYLRLLEVLVIRPETKEEDLMAAYSQAVEGWSQEADFDYTLGKHFASKGQWEKAEYHLHQALNLLEKYGINGKAMVLAGNIQKAYELLAVSCFNNKKMEECLRYTTALLKENPYLMSTAIVMLMAFSVDPQTAALGEEGARQVMAFLGNSFYDFDSLKDRLFVLKAASAAGYQNLVQVIRRIFTPEELEAVDRALG